MAGGRRHTTVGRKTKALVLEMTGERTWTAGGDLRPAGVCVPAAD